MVSQQQIDTRGYAGDEVINVDPIGGGIDVVYSVDILSEIRSNPYSKRMIQWKASDFVPDVIPGESANIPNNVHFIGVPRANNERIAFVECTNTGDYFLTIPSFSETSDEVVVHRIWCAALRPTNEDFVFANPFKDIAVTASPATVNLGTVALDTIRTVKSTDTVTITHTQDFPCVFGIIYKHKAKGEFLPEPVSLPSKIFHFYGKDGSPAIGLDGEEVTTVLDAGEMISYNIVEGIVGWGRLMFDGVDTSTEMGELVSFTAVPLSNHDFTLGLRAEKQSLSFPAVDFWGMGTDISVPSGEVKHISWLKLYGDCIYAKISPTEYTGNDWKVLVYVKYKKHGMCFDFTSRDRSDPGCYIRPMVKTGYTLDRCIYFHQENSTPQYDFNLRKMRSGDNFFTLVASRSAYRPDATADIDLFGTISNTSRYGDIYMLQKNSGGSSFYGGFDLRLVFRPS